MPKKEQSALEKFELCLFTGMSELESTLTPHERQILVRYRAVISRMLDEPLLPDKDFIAMLQTGCMGAFVAVSQRQAYVDLSACKRLIGNVQVPARNFILHTVTEACKKGIQIATEADDADAIAKNAAVLVKAYRLDKPEEEIIDPDDFIPPSFEPSDDVTLVNLKADPDIEKKRSARREFYKRHFTTDVKPEQ
jgi:hypothetical protein